MEVKQDGKHGLTSKEWTKMQPQLISIISLKVSASNKLLIAQIQSIKNGKKNSTNADMMKLKLTQITLKTTFVKPIMIAVLDFVVVSLHLMMKLVSNWEN